MAERTGKTGGNTGDIHEGNHALFSSRSRSVYEELVKRYQWHRIPCAYKAKSSQYTLRTIGKKFIMMYIV